MMPRASSRIGVVVAVEDTAPSFAALVDADESSTHVGVGLGDEDEGGEGEVLVVAAVVGRFPSK